MPEIDRKRVIICQDRRVKRNKSMSEGKSAMITRSFAYTKNEVKNMKTAKERFDLALMNPMADVLEALGTSVKGLNFYRCA